MCKLLVGAAAISVAAAAHSAPITPPEALALYPKAAHDAGIDGRANLTCGLDEHLRHLSCRVNSEDPPNQGFGQAAQALAAMTPPNPDVTALPTTNFYVHYLFCTDPDFINPNPLEPEHLRVGATLDRQPKTDQITAAMSAEARAANLSGRVLLNCTVEADGAVDQCHGLMERPGGVGLSDAAVSLAPLYHASPATIDGKPAPTPIQIQVLFGPNPPLPAPAVLAPADMECRSRAGLPPLSPLVMTQRPTAADVAHVYPRAALRARTGGFANLRCKVQPNGAVADCTILVEAPAGQGFGPAAIALARVIHYAPVPSARYATIPFRFVAPN